MDIGLFKVKVEPTGISKKRDEVSPTTLVLLQPAMMPLMNKKISNATGLVPDIRVFIYSLFGGMVTGNDMMFPDPPESIILLTPCLLTSPKRITACSR